jgi:hypothetical protein
MIRLPSVPYSPWRTSAVGVLALSYWLLAGCSEGGGTLDDAPSSGADSGVPLAMTFNEVFDTVASITLEENDTVINVDPIVGLDRGGGFLIADRGDNKIRRYGPEGSLEWQRGRAGPGPMEFRTVNGITRVGSQLLVIDSHRKSVLWTQGAEHVVRVLSNDFPSVDDVDPVDPSTVLFSTRPGVGTGETNRHIAHLVEISSGRVTRSFVEPRLNDLTRPIVSMAGWAMSDILGNTVATIFALSDTVYFTDLKTDAATKIHLPAEGFRPLRQGPRDGQSRGNWLFSHTFLSTVHWLNPDQLILQYEEFERNVSRSHLLKMRRDGQPYWELMQTPRLHAIDRRSGLYYFDHPEHLTPNVILVAREKQ